MEKHKCKLCFRNFSNGRALGGHMRSHMMNLHVPPKPNESPPTIQLSFEAETSSSPSSSSSGEEEDNKNLFYGLRENPKRSIRVADPEFSFAAAADTGSVILQDRESETESSKNVTRRRSKREWKLGGGAFDNCNNKTMKLSQHGNRNESGSSVSDTTTEEDVAYCLMMLSQDTSRDSSRWSRRKYNNINLEEHELEQEEDEEEDDEEDEEEDEESDDDDEELMKNNKSKTNKVRGGRYKCETCDKVFRSYQALGGHRASHKKIKLEDQRRESIAMDQEYENVNNINKNNNVGGASSTYELPRSNNNFTSNTNKKIHECPVCFRIFASGQALGGHKRTHVTNVATTTTTTRASAAAEAIAVAVKSNAVSSSSTKLGRESLIDLNLPAPVDDDDVSQFEDSAVSDAEFLKPAGKTLS